MEYIAYIPFVTTDVYEFPDTRSQGSSYELPVHSMILHDILWHYRNYRYFVKFKRSRIWKRADLRNAAKFHIAIKFHRIKSSVLATINALFQQ